jgi:hypothetical protein
LSPVFPTHKYIYLAIFQEITCTAEACVGSSKASQKGRRHKMKHRKWLGWLAMGM